MEEEDFYCKFPQLYRGKKSWEGGGNAEEGGSWRKQHGRNFLMGGNWLACGRGESLRLKVHCPGAV